jgi:hypothetical protein
VFAEIKQKNCIYFHPECDLGLAMVSTYDQMNAKHWRLIICGVIFTIIIWDHVGRLNNWTFRPNVGFFAIADFSVNAWHNFGEGLGQTAVFVRHIFKSILEMYVNIIKFIGFLLENMLLFVGLIIGSIFFSLDNIFGLCELGETLNQIMISIFGILVSPFMAVGGWFEFAQKITDPDVSNFLFGITVTVGITCLVLIAFCCSAMGIEF